MAAATQENGPHMVITKFELQNFKSFLTRQELPLAPITLLYGPNGGGKSSVIQALLALRQTLACGYGEFVPNGNDVQLGTFASIVSMQDLNRPVVLAVSQNCDGFNRQPSITNQTIELQFRQSGTGLGGGALDRMTVAWDGEEPGTCTVVASNRDFATPEEKLQNEEDLGEYARGSLFRFESGDSILNLARLTLAGASQETRNRWKSAFLGAEVKECIRRHYIKPNDAGLPIIVHDPLLGCWDFTENGRFHVQELLDAAEYDGRKLPPDCLGQVGIRFAMLYRDTMPLLSEVVHVEPLRRNPERIYQRVPPKPYRPSYDSPESWTDVLYDNPRVLEYCNKWLKNLGTGYRLEVSPVQIKSVDKFYQLLLVDEATEASVTLADVGFGISQMLPILARPHARIADKLICVQQPELHLHPRLQGQLADFFIETACPHAQKGVIAQSPEGGHTMKVGGSQWLIETHSEALITRFQRRVREGTIHASDISVLYVDKILGKGSVVTRLRLGDSGDFIDEWPGGFFEDGFDDIFGIDR